jgi:hypothetical protein
MRMPSQRCNAGHVLNGQRLVATRHVEHDPRCRCGGISLFAFRPPTCLKSQINSRCSRLTLCAASRASPKSGALSAITVARLSKRVSSELLLARSAILKAVQRSRVRMSRVASDSKRCGSVVRIARNSSSCVSSGSGLWNGSTARPGKMYIRCGNSNPRARRTHLKTRADEWWSANRSK